MFLLGQTAMLIGIISAVLTSIPRFIFSKDRAVKDLDHWLSVSLGLIAFGIILLIVNTLKAESGSL